MSDHTITAVIWKHVRPELTITYLRGTSHNCYHESWYEVISQRSLDVDDFKRLDQCGLLGMGQAYSIEKIDTVTDSVPPVTIDQRTGEILDVPPTGYNGVPIVTPHQYSYQRTIVKRICDSGD